MSKFKVGDQVVGNKKANRYGITKEGWKGTVTAVNTYQIRVCGFGSVDEEGFWVDPDCFDLVLPAPNNHLDELISIFTRKNRVVATITKGEQKFTQSISLHKANGDFKAAVKMVMEKLLDRFEAGEQAPLTATSIDWESFKAGKFAVHCDTEEKAREFLKECDEQGIRWVDGTSLLVNSKWTEYKTETLYGFDGEYGLYYGTAWGFNNKPSIDYTPLKPAVKEVKRPAKVGEWIRVTDAGGHDNGTGVFMVTQLAKCSNGWVYVNGRDIGVIRSDQYVVLENYQPEPSSLDSNSKPEQPTSSTGMREVKRPAKPGDFIKIVDSNGSIKNEYQNGDILRVVKADKEIIPDDAPYLAFYCNAKCKYANYDEYVVLENYDYSLGHPKNEPFRKAKVGDKIRIVKVKASGHMCSCEIGEVQLVTYTDSDGVRVENENFYYDKDQEYIIIEEAPEAIEIGDTVKVIDSGLTCSTHSRFIEENAKNFFPKYKDGYTPKNGDTGVVVGRGKHRIYSGDYYAVLSNDKVFCISGKGIEKVR